MKYKMAAAVLSVWVGAVATARAQTVLTLEKCREMAVENNKQAAAARLQQQKTAFDLRSVRANFLPKISGYGYYLYSSNNLGYDFKGAYLPTYTPGTDGSLVPNILTDQFGQPVIGADGRPIFSQYAAIPPMSLEMKINGLYTVGVRLEQPVYMGGKVRSSYKMARLGVELADLNVQQTRAEVVLKSDEAYWQYVKVCEQLKSAESYRTLVEALEKKVKDAVETGMASRNDLLKVEVRLNEARLLVSKAENGCTLARMNLCHVIGLPLVTKVEASDTFSDDREFSFAEIAGDISDRPEYKLLDRDVALKEQRERFVRSEFLPQLGVAVTYGYSHGLNLGGDPLLASAGVSGVASLSVPIFHWGEGRNKVRSARADTELSRTKQEEMEELMQLEEAKYRFSVNDAVRQVELTRKSLEQAAENLKVSGDQYELGMETLVNYLEAQTQWQKAVTDLIDARAELSLSKTRYLKAVGKL